MKDTLLAKCYGNTGRCGFVVLKLPWPEGPDAMRAVARRDPGAPSEDR
ncbi:hypothetical protein [Komagataeibacter sp. FNDCF1]|nr:hypothetical protein [Komagataeibacter sp. FNDCF1]MCE2563706.1 hypothetical protein [Komagataeibacter sp. FNDCF1]